MQMMLSECLDLRMISLFDTAFDNVSLRFWNLLKANALRLSLILDVSPLEQDVESVV